MERDLKDAVTKNGGKIVGGVLTPLGTPDFSSFLLQAQASKAQVVALINAGGDTINSVKQAVEFRITRSEERRVGKACVSTCRSRWSPYHSIKNEQKMK